MRGAFPPELPIEPLDRPVDATVGVPGSKSITNRALILGALADGRSTIKNPLFSDDPYWLMTALSTLGFPLHADSDASQAIITGMRGIIPGIGGEVFVGNAGTVARFLPPMLALGKGRYRVDGVARMRERPISGLVDALRGLGAEVGYAERDGAFPLAVGGGGIRGGSVTVHGADSSQYLSGVLMAAPYARAPVELLASGRKHWPYVGITVDVMREFGVDAEVGNGRFAVEPAAYAAREYEIEPDASAASYFFAAGAVSGGRVRVPGLGARSAQGDLRFVEVLAEMGCEVEVGEDFVEVRGPEKLRGVEVDMGAFSDTMMTLAAIAPFADGPTVIANVGHTRLQETDRVAAVATELARLGIEVQERRDGLRIVPGPVLGGLLRTYGDHRMAMAFSLVGLVVPGITIQDPACVTKTLPDFFDRLDALR